MPNKSSGERIIVHKKLSDLVKNVSTQQEFLNKTDSLPKYMKYIKDSSKKIDLIYDERISNRFKNESNLVSVSIILKDNSGIVIEGTKEEKNNFYIASYYVELLKIGKMELSKFNTPPFQLNVQFQFIRYFSKNSTTAAV